MREDRTFRHDPPSPAWGAIAFLALHLGAVFKHQFLDRDPVLGCMLPFARRAPLVTES